MAKIRIEYEVDNGQLKLSQQELEKLKKEANLTEGEVNKLGKGFEDVEKGTKGASSAMSQLGKLVAGLGLAALAAEAARRFIELASEIQKTRQQIAQLTGESGRTLDALTAKVRAVSNVFDKDYNEVLRTANTLSKQFGVSMLEALDKIGEGFSAGLDINGEYLDILREYSPFIKEIGADIDQFNALIQKQITDGVFSDKGIDSIKEAQVNLREMTQASQDALKAIGINADQVTKDIRSGARTYFDVIQEISNKTRELGDPRVTGQILANIFRGAGEDAGDYSLTIDEVGKAIKDLGGESSRYTEINKTLLEQQTKLQNVWVSLTAAMRENTTELKTKSLPIITELLKVFEGLGGRIRRAGVEIEQEFAGKSIPQMTTALYSLRAELVRVQKEFNEASKETGEHSIRTEQAEDKVKILTREIETLKELIKEKAEAEKEDTDKIDDNTVATDTWSESLSKASNSLDAYWELLVKVEKQLFNVGRRTSLTGEEIGKFGQLDIESMFGGIGLSEGEDLLNKRDEIILSHDAEVTEQLKKNIDDVTQARKDAAEKELEFQQQINDAIISGAGTLFSTLLSLDNDKLRNELQNQNISEQRRKEIQREIAQNEKDQAIFSIIINTANAVVKALPNIALAAIVGGLGAIQLAAVQSKPLPKFHEGEIDIKGKGDEFPAILKQHESVMSPDATKKYKPILEKMQKLELDPDIFIKRDISFAINPVDIERAFEKGFKHSPQAHIDINERGFNLWMRQRNGSYNFQRKRLFG